MARPHAASAWRTVAAEHSFIAQLLVSGRSGTNPGLALAGCKAKSMRGSRRLRGVVERPFGRGDVPDELRELAPVLVVADPAALRREVVLVPPLQLGLGRQRHLAGLLVADQIAADRDHGGAALGPQRGDDVRGP